MTNETEMRHDRNLAAKEPLTEEQLKKKIGDPVWIESARRAEWMILWGYHAPEVYGRAFIFTRRTAQKEQFQFSELGVTWKAYAYPPAHIDKEAWEPCEWCGEWIGGDCMPREQDAGCRLYAGYCKQVAADDFYADETEELSYCPKCGRPLTEKAWAMLEKRMRG